MKKMLIIVLGLSMFLGGCSANTTNPVTPSKETIKVEEKIPESYTIMMKNLKEQNLNSTLDFANLTIKDFPDSPYTYNAHIIRSIILCGKIHPYINISIYINKGMGHMGAFIKDGDIEILEGYIAQIDKSNKSINIPLNESFNYILTNYNYEAKSNKIDFPTSDIKMISKKDYNGFSWFSDVGYPVPKQSDFDEIINNVSPKAFYLYMNNVETSGEINYPKYFLIASYATSDKELEKRLLNKVIELTEEDKYNESRIEAEKGLNNLL